MEDIIVLEGVTWKRGELTLLNDVHWRIRRHEHWALLGLNGSGKTTLLNIITGYYWPTSGNVNILGHRFGEVDLRELRQSIGWVSSSLQEKLYGSDRTQYVVISGKFASIGLYDNPQPEDFSRAQELMATLGCSHLWNREYRTCSQGEKQKLLIARALMADPMLLILDEPCNGLDLFSRERLLASIDDLTRRENMPTIIYVTHHTEEILPAFGRTMLLRRGEAYRQGATPEVMSSSVLSEFFEAPVAVDRHGDRFYVRLSEEKDGAQNIRVT